MSGGLRSIMAVAQTVEEFWRETKTMAGEGSSWPWSWSLAAVLLIFTLRLVSSRFRSVFRRTPSVSVSVKPKEDDDVLPSLRAPGIITDLDLENLINDLEENNPDGGGGVVWENVIDKSNNLISYKAKCCKPKDGPLKYLSTTVFENCSVEALLNFYMDNSYRVQWDKTVVHYQQLQMDSDSCTEFGRTIKKFLFLTPRDYVLAWRIWRGLDGSFYCFSKECEHPLAPHEKRYVRVAVFRSGWRIRKVPGRNACEIKMVHQEDAGLNVEMAKVAFAKGIWSYVRKMDDALRKYSTTRQHQLSSVSSASLSIQKVPPQFEVMNDKTSTDNPENSKAACWSKTRKLKRWPSSKLIANGLVVLGGAICLSRGHSSLGTKVAMAYLLTKLTKYGASSEKD
ncbi:Polyketide cyclase/dehydrase and lipid transport superfamily protein [Striga hermonthica]|uniref:Polyketide cyclase/dehydrase and lipid transport superfamily protein n=1 Tax=Striga hermonthica TaxID=68872 RepID=A0A9N7N4C5_STRHE|nr:Polyketide cyclase/dehydrase and lipid transport superfamily protein [Striga hermonthica]